MARSVSTVHRIVDSKKGMPENERRELKEELDYYQIPLPEDVIVEPHRKRRKMDDSNYWHWDLEKKGERMVISEDNQVALRSKIGSFWNSVIANKPIDFFQVRVQAVNANVGFVTSDFNPNGNSKKSGYFLFTLDGVLSSARKEDDRIYCTSIKEGSIIKATFDRQNGTISYCVNNQEKGIAFVKIPKDIILYPCVELYDQAASVEIIQIM